MASGKSGSGGWSAFVKTTLIPLGIALLLYLVIFQAMLPLYRRYRTNIARYSSYAPLDSSLARRTTSLFDPIIEPSRGLWGRVREHVRNRLWQWAVPGVRDMNVNRTGSRSDMIDMSGDEEMDDELFNETDIGVGEGLFDEHGSIRRLSRELEEGFRDDSESEDEMVDGVTVGRSQSRRNTHAGAL